MTILCTHLPTYPSPIPPGEKFTYEFTVAQHGSYWIHSHFMGQYMDGLRTPFVVHAKNETYKYDHDVTIPFQGKFVSLKSIVLYLYQTLNLNYRLVPQAK